MLHVSDVEFPVAFDLSHACVCTPWPVTQGRWSFDGNQLSQPCCVQPAGNVFQFHERTGTLLVLFDSNSKLCVRLSL